MADSLWLLAQEGPLPPHPGCPGGGRAPQAAPVQAHVPTDGEIPFAEPQTPQPPAVAAQEAASTKPVTLEDLQTTGRKLALAGKQDKLGEILGKYSVRKLSDIPSEHWAEALNEMEVSING